MHRQKKKLLSADGRTACARLSVLVDTYLRHDKSGARRRKRGKGELGEGAKREGRQRCAEVEALGSGGAVAVSRQPVSSSITRGPAAGVLGGTERELSTRVTATNKATFPAADPLARDSPKVCFNRSVAEGPGGARDPFLECRLHEIQVRAVFWVLGQGGRSGTGLGVKMRTGRGDPRLATQEHILAPLQRTQAWQAGWCRASSCRFQSR